MAPHELGHMNMPTPRAMRTVWCYLVLLAPLGACGGGDARTEQLSAKDIEAASARTDSMLAAANRSPTAVLDSIRDAMRATIEARVDSAMLTTTADDGVIGHASEPTGAPGGTSTGGSAASTVGREMSRRAQARGDSLARAMAMRLAAIDESGNRARGDSLRGVLTWQGREPARSVVLKQGDAMITLSGMATTGLSRLVGTEVTVHGVKVSPRDIVVSDYVVRASEGVPAVDGVIESDGSLRLTDGSGVRRVPLPEVLRDRIGSRVWVAVRNGRTTGYGVIGR